jgi:hypothetical protein
MPGDYSRLTFDESRRYTSVRMQQGRVQLDSDWNEQADITRHALETLARDILGDAGVPSDEQGFEIKAVPGAGDDLPAFTIGQGRLYVAGMLCANDAVAPGDQQPNCLPERVLFAPSLPAAAPVGAAVNEVGAAGTLENKETTGEGGPVMVPPDGPPKTLLDEASPDNKPAAGSAYLVYLDAWQQEITAVDHAGLREVALGGIDTATRERTVWQVRLAPFPGEGWRPSGQADATAAGSGSGPAESAAPAPWPAAPVGGAASAAASVAALATAPGAATQPVVAARDTEALKAWGEVKDALGKRGALTVSVDPPESYDFENQLYRVEVHTAGAAGLSLKWARDNASVAFEVKEIAADPAHTSGGDAPVAAKMLPRSLGAGSRLWVSVSDLGQDRHTLAAGATVEIVDRVAALSGQTLPLFRVVEVDWSGRRINVEVTAAATWNWPEPGEQARRLQLRRWDGGLVSAVPSAPGAGSEAGDAGAASRWMTLENGLRVAIEGDEHRPGDYWLITTRFGQNLTWPKDRWMPPHGPQHHYALLAVLYRDGEGWHAADCREVHQPTTRLTHRLDVAEEEIRKEARERERRLLEEVTALNETIGTLKTDLGARSAELAAVIGLAAQTKVRLDEVTARWFEEQTRLHHDLVTDEDLEDGDVVALVSEGSGERGDRSDAYRLVRADRRYAYQVYGVVIPDDNTIATERYPAGALVRVAVYGKVRCKVVGRVTPGDLLVPSRRPGYAQRAGIATALLRPGTVIGKVLTASDPNRDNNRDTIDVIVTLG